MKNKKINFIVQCALIGAMYAALTYAQGFILPGTTSAAVQFRVSEVLNVLAFFTPAAIPGLTLGCVLSNIFSSGLPIDFIVGSLATLLATSAMWFTRKITIKGVSILGLLMPAIFNGILVGWEIEVFFVAGKFHFADFLVQGGYVALGELGVMFVLGIPLFLIIKKRKLDKKLFH